MSCIDTVSYYFCLQLREVKDKDFLNEIQFSSLVPVFPHVHGAFKCPRSRGSFELTVLQASLPDFIKQNVQRNLSLLKDGPLWSSKTWSYQMATGFWWDFRKWAILLTQQSWGLCPWQVHLIKLNQLLPASSCLINKATEPACWSACLLTLAVLSAHLSLKNLDHVNMALL